MNQNSGQPLGERVSFTGAPRPQRALLERQPLAGARVLIRPLRPQGDAPALYAASHPPDGDRSIWTYLYDGPYPDVASFQQALERQAATEDPLFLTVADTDTGTEAATARPVGVTSYMSIVPEHGVIEVGNIWFGPQLKRTAAATETIFLLARHALDELGYRRLEWKCNALNEPSRRAARRFGFAYEGTFANHRVVKGRNRDTAWFAITAQRWPALRAAFEAWLEPANFDATGAQRGRLSQMTAGI